MATLSLKGRIYRDHESASGMYVSVLDDLGIATCGQTIEEAVEMTWHLIDAHLEACRQLGTLDALLAKLGAGADVRAGAVRLHATFSLAGEREITLSPAA